MENWFYFDRHFLDLIFVILSVDLTFMHHKLVAKRLPTAKLLAPYILIIFGALHEFLSNFLARLAFFCEDINRLCKLTCF